MDRFTELLDDEDKFVKPLTLILGLGALIAFLITINGFLLLLRPTWKLRQLPADLVVLAGWIALWSYKKYRLPENKGGVGIVIALTTENDKEKTRVKTDLLRRFEELIGVDQLQEWVTIIPLSNHQAKKVIPILKAYSEATSLTSSRTPDPKLEKRWLKIRNTIKGNLYVFGHVTERQAGENTYFLDTNALVVHMPLVNEMRKQLSQDFLDVWSHQVTFLEKIEKMGFEFTATYWYTAAQYMIGCAAFAYNDIWTALKLHEAVKNKLDVLRFRPTFERTQKRLNYLLSAEHSIIANTFQLSGDLARMKEHLGECLAIDPKHYSGHLLKAITEFLYEENPKKALKTIESISRDAGKNRTWMYSQAFLLMYLEEFDQALRAYRKIANYSFEGEIDFIIPQVIRFNEGQLATEPAKIQSHFILGYLKLKKRLNYPEALEHLEMFLAKANGERKYELVIREAEACIQELNKLMGPLPVGNSDPKS